MDSPRKGFLPTLASLQARAACPLSSHRAGASAGAALRLLLLLVCSPEAIALQTLRLTCAHEFSFSQLLSWRYYFLNRNCLCTSREGSAHGKKKKKSFYHKLKKSSSGCFLFLYILFLKCIFRDSGRATCDTVTGHCGCKDAFSSEPVSSHPARRGQKRRGSLVRLVHSAWLCGTSDSCEPCSGPSAVDRCQR